MTAYQFLHRVIDTKAEIDALNQAIENVEAIATKMTPSMSGMPASSCDVSRKIESAAIKAAEFLDKLYDRQRILIEQKQQALEAINQLEAQTHRTILIERYINGMHFEDIAEKLMYDTSTVYKIHRLALKNIIVPESVQ